MYWLTQMKSIFFFLEKYDYVGRLLKPGELPTNYSDEEEEGSQQEAEGKSKYDWPLQRGMKVKYEIGNTVHTFTNKSENYLLPKQLRTFNCVLYYLVNSVLNYVFL